MKKISLSGNLHAFKKRLSFGPGIRRKFYADLASILRTDSSMSPVQIRVAIEEFKKLPSAPKAALAEIGTGLGRGLDFSKAIENLTPESESMILHAAESTGDSRIMVRLLSTLAANMDESRKIRRAFLGALQQPAFLFLNIGVITVYISDSLLPKIFQAFKISQDRLFGAARISFDLFSFIHHFWFLIVLFPLPVIGVVWGSLRRDFPGRRFLDRLPPWSIYRMMMGTEFLLGLSAMLEAGIPVMQAFEQIRKQAPPYLRARIVPVMKIYRRTGKLGDAMEKSRTHFPSDEIIVRLSLREKYGDLGPALAEFARDWKEDGLPKIERQAQYLNYAAMTLAAVAIGFLGLGILQIVQQAMGGLWV